MVNFAPWEPELGIIRPQDDLMQELRQRGHEVDCFHRGTVSQVGAENGTMGLLGKGRRPSRFAVVAGRCLQGALGEYDIVDSVQGCLPYQKSFLGIRGAHVVRSPGLYLHYDEFEKMNSGRELRERLVPFWKWLARRLRPRHPAVTSEECRESLRNADRIIVLNSDEPPSIERSLGAGARCEVIPGALREDDLDQLARVAERRSSEMASGKVVFLGSWGARKGSHDWKNILQGIWARLPRVQFGFYGTAMPDDIVWRDLGLKNGDIRIELRRHYQRSELPGILENGLIGAFPSYIEGFGISVLEQLAAGIPVVAYDVPGPREMLRKFDSEAKMMVRPGDVQAFADRIVSLWENRSAVSRLSKSSLEVARAFSWTIWVERTIECYQRALESSVSAS